MSAKKNWLEWVVFGVSLAMLVVTLGLLAWGAAVTDDRPPRLALDPIVLAREGDALRAAVTVRNEGDQAAQLVAIEVQIVGGSGEVQQGSFQVELLPGGSSSTGEVVFFGAPAGDLRAEGRVIGYSLP
jgi:uncharacterized protein (TIGR02588 family)